MPPGPGECVRALIIIYCVESVLSLLKRDNSAGERAASHQPFLREQLRLFAAVTDRTNIVHQPAQKKRKYAQSDLCATVYY